MKKTGIVRDDRYLAHVMDLGHPESPERLKVIYRMLEEEEMKGLYELVKPRAATRGELEMNHTPAYIDLIASTAGKPHTRLDMDTSTCDQSYEAALFAAGGLLELIKTVMEGRLQNGFALVRPPGHHAERDRAMGFCLFNNVAIGAYYALQTYSLQRILIVDWDVHHGNGTQNSFYEDPRVLYFSTHRYGFFYPGTGAATEVGKGKGEGFNVNVPLSTGGGDADYGNIFEKFLKPIALEYQPQLVLVSAGFDVHTDDPLGGMQVTEKGFARMTQVLMEIADDTAQGKLVITLEGGYDVSGQSRSTKAVIKELARVSPLDRKDLLEKEKANYPRIEKFLLQLKEIQKRYWKSL
ncbi:MAG: histone deacetylase [Deltaproteobacteria bacterium RBG_16_50_11]|nr:MAG: histone deacetylase [Deltaproteobacteria bacterium RBG_16_50_11]